MSLETPNRIHAAAVCFWELIATAPPDPFDLYSVGFFSRNNFRSIELFAGSGNPGLIQLSMVRPIAKEQAVGMLLGTAITPMGNAGLLFFHPNFPTGNPAFDNATLNDVFIADMGPPDRLTGAQGAVVGDRSAFYLMVLELPPTPEFLAPLGTL